MKPPRAKRSLGQNFLYDPNYIRKIVNAVEPALGEAIIEIGPGRGALTEKLLGSGARVTAVELDRDLIAPLTERFDPTGRFELIESDALEIDFAALSKGDPIKLVANLPYYVSTAILQKLAEQRRAFSFLVLMFQKEVVDRITAAPGNSERGYLTVLTEISFDVEKLFDVPSSAFRPVPKVTSSVVRLTPTMRVFDNESDLKKLVAVAFRQKRKTILNNLREQYATAPEALGRSGIDAKRRAESLSLDEWFRLSSFLSGQS